MKINLTSLLVSIFTTVLLGAVFLHFNMATKSEGRTMYDENISSSTGDQEYEAEPEEDSFIMAVFGVDQRESETARSDAIMLFRYDMKEDDVIIVSVPRDSLVSIPGKHEDKINAAYAYGEEELSVQTLEQLMDIEIDYYATTNFEGFKEIVEVIDGVNVDVERTINHQGVYIPQGEQRLKGEELLMYVRFRGDSDGDFGRINRQQEVLISIAKDLIKPSNLMKIPKIISLSSEYIKTDMNIKDLSSIIWNLKDFNNLTIQNHTLKTTSEKRNGVWYELLDQEDLNEKSDLLKGYTNVEEEYDEEYIEEIDEETYISE